MPASRLTIGSLAKATRTNVETIRFYEKSGLLPKPHRTEGNYRSYEREHLDRLSFIRKSRDLGFSLDQIRELLDLSDDRNRSCGAVDQIASEHLVEVDRKIAALQSLRKELHRMLDQCRHGSVADCGIIGSLSPATELPN